MREMKMKTLGSIFVFLIYSCLNFCYAAGVIGNMSGQFTFEIKLGEKTKKVQTYYFTPKSLNSGSRIVFVLHGAGRDGKGYRDEWQQYAEKYNFLVLCPEFSEAEFPGLWSYNYGNVYDPEIKKYVPHNEWSFNVIEGLFDFVRQDLNLKVEAYCIFGHSAGAQFVHRMVLLMPDARFSLAIANGAGYYTEPLFDKEYIDGLKNTGATEETLKKAFNKEMVILMGDKDFVSKTMPQTPAAFDPYDRVWRARIFFACAKTESEKRQIPLHWTLRYVPGADHNDPKHAEFGSRLAAQSKKKLVSQ